MGVIKVKSSRSFGGKTENFTDKRERAFEQKHLKAYLKGWERFRYGFDINGSPKWHTVKEVWA